MRRRATEDLARQQRIRELVRGQVDMLRRNESVDGGWGYLDFRVGSQRPATSSISFVNATALLALLEAKEIGVEMPAGVVERALAATQRQRKKDNSYLYGEYLHWQ